MNFISFDCAVVTFAHITGTVNSLTFDPMLKIISNADVSICDLATTNLNTIKLPNTYTNAELKIISALKIHLDNITRELVPANTVAFVEQQMKISPDVYMVYSTTLMYLLIKGFIVQIVGATVKNKYAFNPKLTNEFHQINNKGIKAHALNNFTYYLSVKHPNIYRTINKTQAYLVHISDAFMQMICFALEHATYYPRVTFTQIKYVEAATLISLAPNVSDNRSVDNKSVDNKSVDNKSVDNRSVDNKSVLDNIVKKISKEKKSAPTTAARSTLTSVLHNTFDIFNDPPALATIPAAIAASVVSATSAVTPITPLIPVVDIPPGGINLNIVDTTSKADIIALMSAAIDREIDNETQSSGLETSHPELAFEINLRGDYFAAEPASLPTQ